MSNKKGLFKQFSVIGAGTIITLILGLLNTPIITRIVSPNEYGQFSLFITYGNLAVSILLLGLDQALVRYFYDRENISYKSSLVKKSIGIPILTITLMAIVTYVFNEIGFMNINNTYLILLIIYIYVLTIKRFTDLVVRLQFNSKLYSFNNILNKIIYLLMSIPLILWIPGRGSIHLIISTIIAALVVIIIGVYFERDIWNFPKHEDKNNLIDSKKILKYSLPFVFSMSITSLFQANDKLFVNYFTTNKELGIFSAANSIVVLISVFQITFNTVWAPAAIEHYNKYPDDKKYHQNGNNMIVVIMFFIGLTIILFKDVFSLFLGDQFRAASFMVPGLIFGPIMYTISETTVSGIVFKEKSNAHVIIALGALIVDLIANSILVPKYGGVGAGLSTGFSYIIFFSLRTFISNKYYYVDFSLVKFYILTFISFGFAIYNSFVPFNGIIFIWYLFCLLLLYIFYRQTINKGIKKTLEHLKSLKYFK